VRITIKLYDAPHDRLLWGNSYSLDRSNLRALQAELAVTIAGHINVAPVPSAALRKDKPPQANAAAEELYLQGLQQQNANSFGKAIELYQRALGLDPAAAQTHAGLAYCYGRLGETGQMDYADAFSHQKEEAIKAIGLDSSVPEGHIELANAAMNLNWDWVTAAREFSQALRLNPSSALAHERYAIYLERTGNFDGAIDEVNKSMLLDPVSERSFNEAMYTYYFARRYDEALELHRRALAGGILKAPDTFLLGDIYAEKGLYAKSIAAYRGDGITVPGVHVLGHLGYAYARSGNRPAALDAAEKIRTQLTQTGMGRYEIAIVYAGLGNKEQVIF
jgi:tetratricopeptide (TPR) repeat protein